MNELRFLEVSIQLLKDKELVEAKEIIKEMAKGHASLTFLYRLLIQDSIKFKGELYTSKKTYNKILDIIL